jgi:hypothetical protein
MATTTTDDSYPPRSRVETGLVRSRFNLDRLFLLDFVIPPMQPEETTHISIYVDRRIPQPVSKWYLTGLAIMIGS